jgi:Response regulator containing CheY-like receiver, AAA-type ATPase, and DNA-binding domains
MKKRILVIDDDLALRPHWEFLLKKQFVDFHLDWAVSSEEAKKQIHSSIKFQSPYSFIVADIFLAGEETGLDFVEYKNQILPKVPLIVVSSAAVEHVRSRFSDLLADTLMIEKPLTSEKCTEAFEKLFSDSEKVPADFLRPTAD